MKSPESFEIDASSMSPQDSDITCTNSNDGIYQHPQNSKLLADKLNYVGNWIMNLRPPYITISRLSNASKNLKNEMPPPKPVLKIKTTAIEHSDDDLKSKMWFKLPLIGWTATKIVSLIGFKSTLNQNNHKYLDETPIVNHNLSIFQKTSKLIPGSNYISSIGKWLTKFEIKAKSKTSKEPINNSNNSVPKAGITVRIKSMTFDLIKSISYKNIKYCVKYPFTNYEKLAGLTLTVASQSSANIINTISDAIDLLAKKIDVLVTGKIREPIDYPPHRIRDTIMNASLFVIGNVIKVFTFVPFISKSVDVLIPTVKKGADMADLSMLNYYPGSRSSKKLSFSFSGKWSNPMYEIGAAKYLQQNISAAALDESLFLGSSTGSLVATGLALELSLNHLYVLFLEMSSRYYTKRLFGAFCVMSKLMKESLDEWIPEDISDAQGRLFISVTEFPSFKSKRISRFESKEHLIQTILASLFVPFLYEKPIVLDGKTYISGNITDPMPIHDRYTITISSYRKEANISPSNSCSIYDLFGSNFGIQAFSKQLEKGNTDAKSYLDYFKESGDVSDLFFNKNSNT